MLTSAQIAHYRERGYLVVPGVLPESEVASLQAVCDEFLQRSRAVTQSDDVFDLEPSHAAASPAIRRIKNPHLHHERYRDLVSDDRILDCLAPLIGGDIRFEGSKLNYKPAGVGSPVEWHQDFAFYPHTNDDLCAVGIVIDEARLENGAMLVVPGSHTGPIYDHHQDGLFVGAVPADLNVLADAVALEAPAGSITIHHARMLHASAPNRSSRPRRFLLNQYAAADAYPVFFGAVLGGSQDEFDAKIVRGRSPRVARLESIGTPVPIPNFAGPVGTIYEVQQTLRKRGFQEAAR